MTTTNPMTRLRAALQDAITDDDMAAVASRLVTLAKGGDLKAIQMLLERSLGKPETASQSQLEHERVARIKNFRAENICGK